MRKTIAMIAFGFAATLFAAGIAPGTSTDTQGASCCKATAACACSCQGNPAACTCPACDGSCGTCGACRR